MVKIVNDDLFNVTKRKEDGKFGEYYLTSFNSILPEQRSEEEEKKPRQVLSVVHTSEELNTDMTKMQVVMKNQIRMLKVKQVAENKFDADIYLLAIPFTGVLQPLGKSYDYRIYKAFIARSEDYNVSWNSRKYNKIAYLVITLNKTLFKEDNEHHKDQLEFNFVSYRLKAIHNPVETSESEVTKETYKDTFSVKFNPDGTFETTLETEVVDPIDVKQWENQKPFIIFNPLANEEKKGQSEKEQKNPYKKEFQKRTTSISTEGGYSKKVSLKNTREETTLAHSEGDLNNNLGEMIQKALKDEKDKRPKDPYKKGKKNKKRR